MEAEERRALNRAAVVQRLERRSDDRAREEAKAAIAKLRGKTARLLGSLTAVARRRQESALPEEVGVVTTLRWFHSLHLLFHHSSIMFVSLVRTRVCYLREIPRCVIASCPSCTYHEVESALLRLEAATAPPAADVAVDADANERIAVEALDEMADAFEAHAQTWTCAETVLCIGALASTLSAKAQRTWTGATLEAAHDLLSRLYGAAEEMVRTGNGLTAPLHLNPKPYTLHPTPYTLNPKP